MLEFQLFIPFHKNRLLWVPFALRIAVVNSLAIVKLRIAHIFISFDAIYLRHSFLYTCVAVHRTLATFVCIQRYSASSIDVNKSVNMRS